MIGFVFEKFWIFKIAYLTLLNHWLKNSSFNIVVLYTLVCFLEFKKIFIKSHLHKVANYLEGKCPVPSIEASWAVIYQVMSFTSMQLKTPAAHFHPLSLY